MQLIVIFSAVGQRHAGLAIGRWSAFFTSCPGFLIVMTSSPMIGVPSNSATPSSNRRSPKCNGEPQGPVEQGFRMIGFGMDSGLILKGLCDWARRDWREQGRNRAPRQEGPLAVVGASQTLEHRLLPVPELSLQLPGDLRS